MHTIGTVKDAIKSLPLPVNEREFRLAARRLQKNLLSGRSMMIRMEDIPAILMEMDKCRKRRRPPQPLKPSAKGSGSAENVDHNQDSSDAAPVHSSPPENIAQTPEELIHDLKQRS